MLAMFIIGMVGLAIFAIGITCDQWNLRLRLAMISIGAIVAIVGLGMALTISAAQSSGITISLP